jgi:hypothetical protein
MLLNRAHAHNRCGMLENYMYCITYRTYGYILVPYFTTIFKKTEAEFEKKEMINVK